MSLKLSAAWEHKSKAVWRNSNPILALDVIGVEADAIDENGNPIWALDPATGLAAVKMKIGNGKTTWNDLPYTNLFYIAADLLGATTKGDPGPAGPPGAHGQSATISIGTVKSGSSPEFKNVGTTSAAVFDIVLPQGLPGRDGENGRPGRDGANGAATLTIGQVLTGEPGSGVVVTNVGTASAAVLDISIPKGESGSPGQPGPAGAAGPGLKFGQILTGAPGSEVVIANVGSSENPIFDITIPRGADGRDGLDAILPDLPAPNMLAQWSTDDNYESRCLVYGEDDKIYEWLESSGPGTPSGPQNPTTPPTLPVQQVSSTARIEDGRFTNGRSWRSLADNGKGVMVAGTDSTIIAVSQDRGKSWTELTLSYPACACVAYGNGRFVGLPVEGTRGSYSDNGLNWSFSTIPPINNWTGLAYGGGQWVAVSSHSSTVGLSSDGVSWTTAPLPTFGPLGSKKSITYGAGKFLVVDRGSDKAAYSSDGRAWTVIDMPAGPGGWDDVTYGPGKGFVALADAPAGGLSDIAAHSVDGLAWTTVKMPTSLNWDYVTYGEVFVAVSRTGIANGQAVAAEAACSVDGLAWQALPAPIDGFFQDVVYAGNGIYVTITSSKTALTRYSIVVEDVLPEWLPYWRLFDPTPIGQTVTMAGSYIPRDYLPYNRGEYQRSAYPDLWTYIIRNCNPVAPDLARPIDFTTGDGLGTFHMPLWTSDSPVKYYLKAA